MRYPLDRPLPKEITVADGLAAYLEENGFTRELYDARTTPASFLGLTIPVPNTKKHRFAIMRHDLHHVATGFGTDLTGEGEISAWEARRGFGKIGLYTSGIVGGLVLIGFVVAPRRTLEALRASAGGRETLFHDIVPYEELLALTVGELRRRLAVPEDGLAGPRRLHPAAPPTRAPAERAP